MSVRPTFATFIHARKLSQQFIVDAYCQIESLRLQYIRTHQKDLRVEQYRGLYDYIKGRSQGENYQIGKTIILPSTFEGSPRNMAQNYQDAMTLVSRFGKPDLFITYTCNGKWREISENLDWCKNPIECAELVSRVFNAKLSSLMKE